MTEQELRAMVRDAIARHAGASAAGASIGGSLPASGLFRLHPSHGLFMVPSGSDTDGPCIIEPAVPCNHCGYCKSYGH
jgi:hypothetical protein